MIDHCESTAAVAVATTKFALAEVEVAWHRQAGCRPL